MEWNLFTKKGKFHADLGNNRKSLVKVKLMEGYILSDSTMFSLIPEVLVEFLCGFFTGA